MTKQKKLVEIQLLPCSDGGYIVKHNFNDGLKYPEDKYDNYDLATFAIAVSRCAAEFRGYTVKLVYGSDSAIISNPA